ncbi:MAG: hypothetical protein MR842_00235 [Clostridiales bacterium]|nr:hypothetical protein [Clostridiales bacterium]MDY4009058.1 hypothetical protein [Candidatus Limiplasma sp.]
MNGFANTLLTLLLSWLRALINNIWRVLSSEDGGAFYQFLSKNWKVLVLLLCIGGFVIDRVIYLFRWRPYYVWMSRHGRRRRASAAPVEPDAPEDAPLAAAEPYEQEAPYAQPEPLPYAPPSGGVQVYEPINTFAPEAETRVFEAARTGFQPEVVNYAPAAPDFAPQTAYMPAQPEALEPVFDEEPVWEAGAAWQNPAEGMTDSFGMPKPEPIAYIRDMQAGFAPPVPPEQLYAPPAATAQPPVEAVHPGLDEAAFRQSFGLTQPPPIAPPGPSFPEEAWEDETEPQDSRLFVMRAPAFQPFTARSDGDAGKARGPLARLAKKARDLVGGDDEENRPTIHDLQSTVDVSQAFHEPVYPQPRQGGDEE